MNVAVLGLWHLGSVTAACVAQAGHVTVGWDPDPSVVDALGAGRAPLAEPGLDALLAEGIAAGRLRFTASVSEAVASADVVWVTFDTPVDDDDRADVEYVVDHVQRIFPYLRDGAVVLSSSQLPVGTVSRLELKFADVTDGRRIGFAVSPENLRLGTAIQVFTQPDRVIAGVRDDRSRTVLEQLFSPLTDRLVWMSVESAEMTKHAINAFLATSVTFINEIGTLCEQVGADAVEVERGLKSEQRIGPKAYLSPGAAFAGGTLARDIAALTALGEGAGLVLPLLRGVRESNVQHRSWPRRALDAALGDVRHQRIAVWGLTYKPGTDTLRRSSSVELCLDLRAAGADVVAYDPAVRTLPADVARAVRLATDARAAVAGAHALVIATPWPAFREVQAGDVVPAMARPVVIDAGRYLSATLGADSRVTYRSVGRTAR